MLVAQGLDGEDSPTVPSAGGAAPSQARGGQSSGGKTRWGGEGRAIAPSTPQHPAAAPQEQAQQLIILPVTPVGWGRGGGAARTCTPMLEQVQSGPCLCHHQLIATAN